MSTRIKTTGELRDFLAGVMLKVRSGEIELDKARSIAKLAGQINESFYAELKVAAGRLLVVKIKRNSATQTSEVNDVRVVTALSQ